VERYGRCVSGWHKYEAEELGIRKQESTYSLVAKKLIPHQAKTHTKTHTRFFCHQAVGPKMSQVMDSSIPRYKDGNKTVV